MENKKDIGRAFSDKLNSLDKTPRENVWNGISYELQKKKKRRIAFFFFWTKTIGLLLAGAIAAFYVYHATTSSNSLPQINSNESTMENGTGKNTKTTTVSGENTNTIDNKNTITSDGSIGNGNKSSIEKETISGKENNITSKNGVNNEKTKTTSTTNSNNSANGNYSKANTLKVSKGKNKLLSKVSLKKLVKKSSRKTKSKHRKSKENNSKDKTISNKNTVALFDPTSLQTAVPSDKTTETALKKTDSIAAKKEKDKVKTITMYPKDPTKKDSIDESHRNFDIDVFVSPTLYGSFPNKSMFDTRLDSLSRSSKIQFSFGVGISFNLTERISFRLGFQKTNASLITKGAAVNTANYNNIGYNSNVSNQSIYAASNNAQTMDITQKISYTEIPMEVKYKFLDKKIGVKGIFGFSYLLLNDNEVSIKTDTGFSQTIGKTSSLSKMAFSANFGIGLDYQIAKKLKLILEPMFNYQLKTFENNTNVKPFVFGIRTGIQYSFQKN
ncbi:outer membrane beta-barrel protein [Flavobacterium sp.]|uniref:outer membrane beta-barrel protein n=1 Tax=Flavobacterium sp. TaxID=239 RepID=UPI002FDAD93A